MLAHSPVIHPVESHWSRLNLLKNNNNNNLALGSDGISLHQGFTCKCRIRSKGRLGRNTIQREMQIWNIPMKHQGFNQENNHKLLQTVYREDPSSDKPLMKRICLCVCVRVRGVSDYMYIMSSKVYNLHSFPSCVILPACMSARF